MNEIVIYEQPLNEVIRACLRLEYIFEQIDHHMNDNSMLGARHVISLIINILQLLDRPDLKAKLAKELSQHLSYLTRYDNLPQIDSEKLQQLTQQLKDLSCSLIDSSGKIGYRLREFEFLNSLRLHLSSPGGGCSFDIPLFQYWLQQPSDKRQSILQDWLSDFQQIKTAIRLVLYLVRKNVKVEEKSAVHGFYQELLDPQSNLRMIRIGIARELSTYPEISVGRHFLGIRFYTPDIEKRPTQFGENLPFLLTYCNLLYDREEKH